jgi:carboxyl-terminal processing protease
MIVPPRQSHRLRVLSGLLLLLLALASGCTSIGSGASPSGGRTGAATGAAQTGRNPAPSPLTFDELEDVAINISRGYVERVEPQILLDGAVKGFQSGATQAGMWPLDASLVTLNTESTNPSLSVGLRDLQQKYVMVRRKSFVEHRNADFVTPMIKGMVDSLNDPATSFLTRDDVRNQVRNEPGGVGISFAYLEGESQIAIGQVFGGGPAEKAGVRAGELLVAIDGRSTTGMNQNEVVRAVRGSVGAPVTLTLRNPSTRATYDVAITRELVFPFRVRVEEEFAYIEVAAFDRGMGELVTLMYRNFLRGGASGWILDLRGNRGGGIEEISEVLQIGRILVGDRPLGYATDRAGMRTELGPISGPNIPRLPLVILVDSRSGSGAEVLAAAVREYAVAVVVGVSTSGAGVVTSDLPLSNGSAVRIAVQSLSAPSGAALRGVGVTPDLVAETTPEDRTANRDPAVAQAVALLRSVR